MAFRSWARVLLAAFGVGALAAASQLGIAYGLGIVRLTRAFAGPARDQWPAQLAWVSWFAMVAAILGATAAAALLARYRAADPTAGDATRSPAGNAPDPSTGDVRDPSTGDVRDPSTCDVRDPSTGDASRPPAGTSTALAVCAGLGAAVVLPLTMQPARTAQVADLDPMAVIGLGAGIGALVGVVAALAALLSSPLRRNLALLIAAVWLVGVGSALPSFGAAAALPSVRLGVLDVAVLGPAVSRWTVLGTIPALALLAGAVVGWTALRRRPTSGRSWRPTALVVALAGTPGPLLLALAYLIAGPGVDGRYQLVPYRAALLGVGAGLLGSALAAGLRRVTTGRRELPAPEDAVAPDLGDPTDPPDDRPPTSAEPDDVPRPSSSPYIPSSAPLPATDAGHRSGASAPGPGRPADDVPGLREVAPKRPGRRRTQPAEPVAKPGAAQAIPVTPAPSRPQPINAPPPQPSAVSPPPPQPSPVSPPPPQPSPVSPPLPQPTPVAPRPNSGPGDPNAGPADPNAGPGDPNAGPGDPNAAGRRPGRAPTRRQADDEYVDWVSGLGGE